MKVLGSSWCAKKLVINARLPRNLQSIIRFVVCGAQDSRGKFSSNYRIPDRTPLFYGRLDSTDQLSLTFILDFTLASLLASQSLCWKQTIFYSAALACKSNSITCAAIRIVTELMNLKFHPENLNFEIFLAVRFFSSGQGQIRLVLPKLPLSTWDQYEWVSLRDQLDLSFIAQCRKAINSINLTRR